jgi:Spy/CpxP family protein refolding chaperone
MLRALFLRLGTTPGQEKVIVTSVEELRGTMKGAKEALRGTRKDLADAFRRGPIDEAAMADIFVRHDTVISETRRKAVESLGRIHEALTDEQRAEVADLIENGPGFAGRFGAPWGRNRGYRW